MFEIRAYLGEAVFIVVRDRNGTHTPALICCFWTLCLSFAICKTDTVTLKMQSWPGRNASRLTEVSDENINYCNQLHGKASIRSAMGMQRSERSAKWNRYTHALVLFSNECTDLMLSLWVGLTLRLVPAALTQSHSHKSLLEESLEIWLHTCFLLVPGNIILLISRSISLIIV